MEGLFDPLRTIFRVPEAEQRHGVSARGEKKVLLGPHILPKRLYRRSHNEGLSLHLTTVLLYAEIDLSSGGQENLFLKVSEHKLEENGLYFLLIFFLLQVLE